eukprot:1737860-Amphidinium_carterae.1
MCASLCQALALYTIPTRQSVGRSPRFGECDAFPLPLRSQAPPNGYPSRRQTGGSCASWQPQSLRGHPSKSHHRAASLASGSPPTCAARAQTELRLTAPGGV